MIGFFERMAQRATGTETRWAARPRARYEVAPPGGADGVEGRAGEVRDARGPDERRSPVGREPVGRGPAAAVSAPTVPAPVTPADVPAAARPDTAGPRAGAVPPAPVPTFARGPVPVPPPVHVPAVASSTPTPPDLPIGPRPAPADGPDVLDRDDRELSHSRPERAVDDHAARPERVAPVDRARPAAPEIPGTAELLRVHVVPALESRGLLEPGERVELVDRTAEPPPAPSRAPQPGRVDVVHGEVRTSDPTAPDVHTTEVHVHIDRVEVVRAAPPAPPPPAPALGRPGPSRLDEYLEQRQAGRR